MLFSLSWLKDYVDLPEVSEVAERLTRAGSEVERISHQEVDFEGVIVGRVDQLRPHPNADKLQLARVSIGKEQLEVVTGATNLSVGDLVPLATNGSRLKDRRIGSQTFRGIRSEGMLCSAIELGLGQDAAGILILDRGADPGEDVADLFPPDTILEVEIKSNRPDLLCHVGLARELSAIFEQPLRPPATGAATGKPGNELVSLKSSGMCRRFLARAIRGVRVGSSPAWMQARLRAAGVRPINNLVDITNYVMLELGQPMHAFDRNRLAGGKLLVREAHEGESLACLDGKTRTLGPLDIVVADADKAQALAGVIGGSESAVSDATTEIILEAATWDPRRVRASSHRLGLRTEASSRFEKGLSPALGRPAIERAGALIAELAAGEAVETSDLYEQPLNPVQIDLPSARIQRVLGVEIPIEQAARILRGLAFEVNVRKDGLRATPPEFRLDCVIPEDLVEEVGRIYGYDRIPSTLPGRRVEVRDLYQRLDADERAREILVGAGFDEAVTNSLVSSSSSVALRLPAANPQLVLLRNPMAENRDALRASLLPCLLEALAFNSRQDQPAARLFEIGSLFWSAGDKVDEPRALALVAHVPGGPEASLTALRELQQTLQLVRQRLAFAPTEFQAADAPGFHTGRAAAVLVGGASVGLVGEVHLRLSSGVGLSGRVVAAEVLFDRFIDSARGDPSARPLPRFPGIRRDLTVVVRGRLSAAELMQVMRRLGGYTLREIYMLTEYRGAQLGEGARSLSFRLHYQADDRTLTNEEVADSHLKIVEGLKQINAEVRS